MLAGVANHRDRRHRQLSASKANIMPDETGKSKLFIDEDWKSQVEAEKAAAAGKTSEAAAAQPQDAGDQPGEMPPPTLSSLVITLATQSMAAMGLLAGPDGKPLPVEADQAKYLIDTIAMLEEKTANNRTADESKLFEEALHQLRMTFVAVGKGL
jgi:hypothetical protein